jgi:hypothetical protein
VIVIQVVEILWTKATRCAPRSRERVQLPRAFVFESTSAAHLVQQYRLAEWEDFQPKLVKSDLLQSVPTSVGAVRIASQADGVFALGFLGTPNSGQPSRRPIREAIRLSVDQYARLIVNARHTSYSGQHYTETVYNIASGHDLPANRFLRVPEHELDLKANLF